MYKICVPVILHNTRKETKHSKKRTLHYPTQIATGGENSTRAHPAVDNSINFDHIKLLAHRLQQLQ